MHALLRSIGSGNRFDNFAAALSQRCRYCRKEKRNNKDYLSVVNVAAALNAEMKTAFYYPMFPPVSSTYE